MPEDAGRLAGGEEIGWLDAVVYQTVDPFGPETKGR